MLVAVVTGWTLASPSAAPSDPSGLMGSRNSPPPTRDLRVTVQLRNNEGILFCALWPGSKGYPVERKWATHDGFSKQLANRRAEILLQSITDGEYALACFHDENGNHTLDTNFLGIPSEGTGASNDARGFMGPPRYDAARFIVSPKGPESLTIRIRY